MLLSSQFLKYVSHLTAKMQILRCFQRASTGSVAREGQRDRSPTLFYRALQKYISIVSFKFSLRLTNLLDIPPAPFPHPHRSQPPASSV